MEILLSEGVSQKELKTLIKKLNFSSKYHYSKNALLFAEKFLFDFLIINAFIFLVVALLSNHFSHVLLDRNFSEQRPMFYVISSKLTHLSYHAIFFSTFIASFIASIFVNCKYIFCFKKKTFSLGSLSEKRIDLSEKENQILDLYFNSYPNQPESIYDKDFSWTSFNLNKGQIKNILIQNGVFKNSFLIRLVGGLKTFKSSFLGKLKITAIFAISFLLFNYHVFEAHNSINTNYLMSKKMECEDYLISIQEAQKNAPDKNEFLNNKYPHDLSKCISNPTNHQSYLLSAYINLSMVDALFNYMNSDLKEFPQLSENKKFNIQFEKIKLIVKYYDLTFNSSQLYTLYKKPISFVLMDFFSDYEKDFEFKREVGYKLSNLKKIQNMEDYDKYGVMDYRSVIQAKCYKGLKDDLQYLLYTTHCDWNASIDE